MNTSLLSAPTNRTVIAAELCDTTPIALLQYLIDSCIIHPEEWQAVPVDAHSILGAASSRSTLLEHLVELNLLNPYQAARVEAGTSRGLILGNYRVLGRIGAGGLGIVFEAEHVQMRRKVAIKVMPVDPHEQTELIARFLREIRCVALLDHPNIVAAIDAGVSAATAQGEPDLYYFVMEHLAGRDLEQHVEEAPLPVAQACAVAYQIASALDEAHRHQLVHRDIKPSNIFLTQDGGAKLLDFGLVRHLRGDSLTVSNDLIGTLDYMAPEQARDATAIDIRADIFSLGATLFYALVGQSPFPLEGSVHDMLCRRQSQQPRSASTLRDGIPAALDAVLLRMMALLPEERFASPQAVMHALLPFLERESSDPAAAEPRQGALPTRRIFAAAVKRPCVLIVEPDADLRQEMARVLTNNGVDCLEAIGADTALPMCRGGSVEAILVGIDAPEAGGRELLSMLRSNPPRANLKIVITSERANDDELAAYLSQGADDCFALPLSDAQLVARVKAAVRHKDTQDQLDRLNLQLLELNVELERGLSARSSDVVQTRNSLVLALAKLVEYRSMEPMSHLSRIQRYCATLAQEASVHPRLAGQIDLEFIQMLECVAPLHDLGNVGLPDAVLLKAGPLDPKEREQMQRHTLIGAETLAQVAHRFGAGAGFLRMAIDVARHHHEHYDGTGYPDRLAGNDIPLAARIVALADAYDALRSRRAQRPRLSHPSAVQIILEASPGKFDPVLLSVFKACAANLDRIYRDVPDSIAMD